MTSVGGVEQDQSVHPIVHFAVRLKAALDVVADAATWSMTPDEERDVLIRLDRSAARVCEVRLRVLAACDRDDVGKADGSASTAAWLAGATRRGRSRAHAEVRLARALDEQLVSTRQALATGQVDEEQARVIASAVEMLPASAGPGVRRRAEQHLVALARTYDARELKVLGRRIFDVVDPDAADAELGRQLARGERAARRRTYLTLFEHDDGTTSGSFRVPTLHAHMLRKALDAFTSPRRTGREGRSRPDGTPMDRPELLGSGFCELIERYPSDRLPSAGGVNAVVVVTLSLAQLRAELATASLDTGAVLSAGEARRLACEAGIIPAVLDGRSMPLDLGREQRLHNRYQRVGLGLSQATCAEASCDRPAAWCEAHHKRPWSEGGSTSVEDGELLCSWHHHRAHDPTYAVARDRGGTVRFRRRT